MNKNDFISKYFDLNEGSKDASVLHRIFFDGYIEEFAGIQKFIKSFCNDDLTINIAKIERYIKENINE
jgi:hypothetical protein